MPSPCSYYLEKHLNVVIIIIIIILKHNTNSLFQLTNYRNLQFPPKYPKWHTGLNHSYELQEDN